MICRDRKIIFVHIPKCGGTSIENVLWPDRAARSEEDLWGGIVKGMSNRYMTAGLQHLTAHYIREAVGAEMFAACYRFAVVRDPLRRLVSQYLYMETRDALRRYIGMRRDDSFSVYLDRIAARDHAQWLPQVAFVTDADGSLMVDDIHRLEDISKDVTPLARRLGLDLATLPHKNNSKSKRRAALTQADVDRVFDRYAKDYALFGYPMDSHGLVTA